MEKIRIMLVDDHILMRMGLVSAANGEADMIVVAEAENAEEAINGYREHRPDVVIMDLRMPKTDGIELTRSLCQKFGAVRVLVFSNYAAGDDVIRAIQAGAYGYLMKGMPLERLIHAIRTVYAGDKYIPPELVSRFASMLQTNFVERELDVLKLIARGLSNKQIAAQLNLAEGTIKMQVTSILAKLRAADRTEAVVIAVKRHILQLE